MSITVNNGASDVVYSRYRLEGKSATYISAANSDLDKDQLVLTSELTGSNSVSYGNRRSIAKFIDTQQVATPTTTKDMTVARDMKLEFNASVPVGATLADITAGCHKLAALLQDPAFVQSLLVNGQIDR